jgi:hypothetical protein
MFPVAPKPRLPIIRKNDDRKELVRKKMAGPVAKF